MTTAEIQKGGGKKNMKDKLISELIKRYKLLYCWLLLLIPNDVVYDCKMCHSIIIL